MALQVRQLENRTKLNHRSITTSDLIEGLQVGLAASYVGQFVYPTSCKWQSAYKVQDDVLAELTASGAFEQYDDGESHAFKSRGVAMLAIFKLTGGR